MYGWIIVNGFLYTSKFSELTDLFMEAAKEHKIDLFVKTNSECFLGMFELTTEKKPDFVLFWDKDILLAKYLASCGIPVYNSADGIEICDDKRKTALALSLQNLPQPLTFPAPMTYENIGFTQLDFLSQIESKLVFPIIVKEAFGSFGQQVYMAKDHKELSELQKNWKTCRSYISNTFVRAAVVISVCRSSEMRSSLRWKERPIPIFGQMFPMGERCMSINRIKKLSNSL